MVAEPRRIESLPSPPPGWTWDPEESARLRRERTREKVLHVGPSLPGPRPEAMATAELPTFPSDSTNLPRRCAPCGSAYLHREPPMGSHQRGMISCGRCGRQVCWLTAPLAPLGARTSDMRAPRPSDPRPLGALPSKQHVMSRFVWLDGCSRACGVLYGHDAATHESYGREMARAEHTEERPKATIVRTGPLVVDCNDFRAYIDGDLVPLSASEIKVLIHLAEHLGSARSHRQIVEAVWDQGTVDTWGNPTAPHGQWHGLRVHIARLRGKLGAARRLVGNRPGVGYVLISEPPTGEEVVDAS